ncbi:MAG: hypothetical protein DF168_00617 [Candidatus Moanabacter tarae]|uniref:Uncharacterized protein n=1 Tax=Candidatus Moanibacter tarae TaxID=2200854 RepID=A0A2Z4AEN1_9BACT|nr:MAG: hypothetical protein DF168_00617 [Candidatus Moanabacter tarae]|tara:strand:+ start:2350 stop:2865 length:516 start_codon:yes stop_codon:yes gene_type:complete
MEIPLEQRKAVASWVREGLSLAEIQRLLDEKFSISITYMDVRFLVDDLELTLQDDGSESNSTMASNDNSGQGPSSLSEDQTDPMVADEELLADTASEIMGPEVSIEVDSILKPGALVSGNARFSDGVKAEWAIDQLGRLAFTPDQEGYKPSSEDLQVFQQKLQSALEKKGF